MFSKAYIQEQGSGKLGYEESLIVQELDKRDIPYSLFTNKRVRRRQLELDRQTYVAGDMDTIYSVLKQLDIAIPKANSYPGSLKAFLHRKVWRSTLGKVEESVRECQLSPVFIKPASREKTFTGLVVDSLQSLYFVGNTSRRQEVWCADLVDWLSEYRVYVVDSEIRSIDHYDGDEDVCVDYKTVEEAIKYLDDTGESHVAYAIDFGVLSTGQTALIEMNDAFAVGAYKNISAKDYIDMTMTRWKELMEG